MNEQEKQAKRVAVLTATDAQRYQDRQARLIGELRAARDELVTKLGDEIEERQQLGRQWLDERASREAVERKLGEALESNAALARELARRDNADLVARLDEARACQEKAEGELAQVKQLAEVTFQALVERSGELAALQDACAQERAAADLDMAQADAGGGAVDEL